jgi:PAS domain S-box-containing protein
MEVTYPDDRSLGLNDFRALAVGTIERVQLQKRYVRKDGCIVWGEVTVRALPDKDGKIFCFLATVQDITERKRTEEELHNAREHLEATLNALPDLLFEVDRDGRIFDYRAPHPELLYASPKEFLGKSFANVLPEEVARVLADAIAQAAQEGFHSGATYPLSLPGGTSWFEASIARQGNPSDANCRFIVLVRDVTDRRRLEDEILQISEREQRRIGQDLHDSLSQNLTAIACLTRILTDKLKGRAPEEHAEAARIGELMNQAITEARNLARGLHPVKLDAEGFMSALQELAATAEGIFRVPCIFECPTPVFISDNFKATHLYRIAQEAVNNALKHGRATRISIGLSSSGNRTSLVIRDDGLGISGDPSSDGMGLRIMDYRARAIGASLQITRDSGGGTVVNCVFEDENQRT